MKNNVNFKFYLDFFYKFSPNFSERFEKSGVKFLFSSFVSDHFSNFAVIEKASDIKVADEVFKRRNLEPIYYSERELEGFEIAFEDNYLMCDNLDELYEKYERFKSSDTELVEVSEELEEEYCVINDLCFKAESYDNPYSNLDNIGYAKCVLDFAKHETISKTTPYIIRYKGESVGAIVLTIVKEVCYITGFTILPKMRRTRVFLSMLDVLKVLRNKNVKNIFCITELGEYPDKLYRNLGFKSVGVMTAYKKKS